MADGVRTRGRGPGLFVVYRAYRGYRRDESHPMLFMSLGLVLVVGVPVLPTVPFLLMASIPRPAYQFAVGTSAVAGPVCLVHALRVDPGE